MVAGVGAVRRFLSSRRGLVAVLAVVVVAGITTAAVALRGGSGPTRVSTTSSDTATTASTAATEPDVTPEPLAAAPTTSSTWSGPPECTSGQLSSTLTLNKADYAYGSGEPDPIVMTLTVTNSSTRACSVRLRKGTSRSPTFVAYYGQSGGNPTWSSTLCHHDDPPVGRDTSETWNPGQREALSSSWNASEITYGGPTCTSGPAQDGPYYAVATWPGAHPYVTSNRVSFRIFYESQPTTTSTTDATTASSTTSTSTSSP
jgi:hypothetical protein